MMNVSKVNKGHESSGAKRGTVNQGRIYGCDGPRSIKIWRALSVTTILGY